MNGFDCRHNASSVTWRPRGLSTKMPARPSIGGRDVAVAGGPHQGKCWGGMAMCSGVHQGALATAGKLRWVCRGVLEMAGEPGRMGLGDTEAVEREYLDCVHRDTRSSRSRRTEYLGGHAPRSRFAISSEIVSNTTVAVNGDVKLRQLSFAEVRLWQSAGMRLRRWPVGPRASIRYTNA